MRAKIFCQLCILFIVSMLFLACSTEDSNHKHNYRTFLSDGTIKYGHIADSYSSDLVMYIPNGQFIVMKQLIQDFQKKHPKIRTVYVETISAQEILKEQILKQGIINGEKTAQNPDLYASFNLAHLKTLKSKNIMHAYMTYMYNIHDNNAKPSGYLIGSLNTAKNLQNAQCYLSYLRSDDAQGIYESFGFLRANNKDLILKKIPLGKES